MTYLYIFKANFIKDPKNAAKEFILQKNGHSGIGEISFFEKQGLSVNDYRIASLSKSLCEG